MMDKQEEVLKVIAQELARIDGYEWKTLSKNLKSMYLQNASVIADKLHFQGVVIKVKGNTTDFIKCPCDDCTAEHKLLDEWGFLCDLACGKRSHWISRCMGAEEAIVLLTHQLIKEG